MTAPREDLGRLLEEERDALIRFVRLEAGGRLLRFETAEDLVQGAHVRALRARGDFEWRGRPALRAWLFRIARSHLRDRYEYWTALRRDAGPVLRMATGSSAAEAGAGTRAGAEPAASATGPSTFAGRREEMELAIRALDQLASRDRDLVRWATEGVEVGEVAARLRLSPESAARARLRAFEKLRARREAIRRSGPGGRPRDRR